MIHEVNDDIAIRVGDSTVTVPAKTILHDLLTRLQPRSTTTGSTSRFFCGWPT